MKRVWPLLAALWLAAACGGDDDPEPLFPERAECEGAAVSPLDGKHVMLMSHIEIGDKEDGFDFDNDGEPDNQLFGIADLAGEAIEDNFANFEIIVPFEFFDVEDDFGPDECVKFGVYLGAFKRDGDGDGAETAEGGGDCNDGDDAVSPGSAEIIGNFYDDDCDGLADEDGETPSADTEDRDSDGVTIAAGDCDDTNDQVGNGPEICGDGLDNDCDGVADWSPGATPACTPYDDDTPDAVALDAQGFDNDGNPLIAFKSATIFEEDGALMIEAGPSLFSINIPIDNDVALDLRLTGATIRGELVMTPGGWAIKSGRLGGVIDANTADRITGIEVDQIGLAPEDSLLDAIFANVLGVFLALPKADHDEYFECHVPDIDVDQDGYEIFCDSDLSDDIKTVDLCVDGDGTVVRDEGGVNCTEAVDEDGVLRFQDGISVELNFETAPAMLEGPVP